MINHGSDRLNSESGHAQQENKVCHSQQMLIMLCVFASILPFVVRLRYNSSSLEASAQENLFVRIETFAHVSSTCQATYLDSLPPLKPNETFRPVSSCNYWSGVLCKSSCSPGDGLARTMHSGKSSCFEALYSHYRIIFNLGQFSAPYCCTTFTCHCRTFHKQPITSKEETIRVIGYYYQCKEYEYRIR